MMVSTATTTYPQDSFHIAFAPLSVDEVYRLSNDAANGAIVVMSGTVREQTSGKPVAYLEYQAYEPMAIALFQQIAHQIRQQWSQVNRVIIHHRIGRLNIGEISVLVAVGCAHRGEAFAACQYAIDTLKHNAPIWKKEAMRNPDGSLEASWVNCPQC